MRVIIPAAGVGSRLRPHTERCPKAAIRVAGRPLLAHMLETLGGAGVDEVVCVSGWLGDVLERTLEGCRPRPRLVFVRNPCYATTNSIVSIALTRDWWQEEFCIIDSDVCVRPQVVDMLLSAHGNALVIDASRSPEVIDMKAEVRGGRVWYLDKKLPSERTGGEFFGLSRWSTRGSRALSDAIDQLLGQGCDDAWYEFAIREVAQSVPIQPLYTDASQWIEVDTSDDLGDAERFFRQA